MRMFSNKPSYKDAAKPTVRKETVTVSGPKLRQATNSARPSPQPSLSSLKSKASSSSLSARTKAPRATGPPDPSTRFRSTSSSSSLRALADPTSRCKSKSTSPYPPSSDGKSRKRKAPASPATPLWETETGSSTDDDDWDTVMANKRRRLNAANRVDKTRVLRNEHSFLFLRDLEAAEKASNAKTANGYAPNCAKRDPLARQRNSDNRLKFRHAADLASLALGCQPVLGAKREEVALELQYPGALARERFELVSGRDKIEAAPQILQTVKHVAYSYLAPAEAEPFTNRKTGLVRRIEKAINRGEADEFKSAVNDYNTKLLNLHTSGAISRNLSTTHNLPTEVTNFILDQVYDRAVAPKVEQLLKYENGTDYVYGELLHPFITEILTVRSTMTSESVFVDLGSGVGNVVLQAAIEIGCESWGCEMMPNACDLAEAQLVEFKARKRLWGINTGEVHLERGDFRKNRPIMEALKRADVVLVNNQVFTAALNDDLVRMFLDLKRGCKIISLKSFVHEHKGSAHNANDVGRTILDVVDYTYPEGYVSWTGNGGNYCVSTRR